MAGRRDNSHYRLALILSTGQESHQVLKLRADRTGVASRAFLYDSTAARPFTRSIFARSEYVSGTLSSEGSPSGTRPPKFSEFWWTIPPRRRDDCGPNSSMGPLDCTWLSRFERPGLALLISTKSAAEDAFFMPIFSALLGDLSKPATLTLTCRSDCRAAPP